MKKSTIVALICFLAIELLMLCLILWGPGEYIKIFEYTSIVICFIFSLFFVCCSPKVWLTELALFFTSIADLFLEIVDPMIQTIAMTSFAIVQVLHFARLFCELSTKKWKLVNIIVRASLILIFEIITVIVLKEKTDYLSVISIFYFANLLCNIVLAFFEFKKSPLLAFGLLLFLGCDVFIGLQTANGIYIDIPTTSILYKIIFVDFNIAWLCYLPSQVLIATSVMNTNKNIFNFKLDK